MQEVTTFALGALSWIELNFLNATGVAVIKVKLHSITVLTFTLLMVEQLISLYGSTTAKHLHSIHCGHLDHLVSSH